MEPEDEDGYATLKAQDKQRFQIAWNGDYLMVAFQCDLCHFHNINRRGPIEYKSEDMAVLGIVDPFPTMGPFPVEDRFGMKAAAIMLMRSLDVGKYAPTIQFSTM
jgi:hypothetical protein